MKKYFAILALVTIFLAPCPKTEAVSLELDENFAQNKAAGGASNGSPHSHEAPDYFGKKKLRHILASSSERFTTIVNSLTMRLGLVEGICKSRWWPAYTSRISSRSQLAVTLIAGSTDCSSQPEFRKRISAVSRAQAFPYYDRRRLNYSSEPMIPNRLAFKINLEPH